MPPATHKPGAVPLRPLGLGDMYDAAFKIIRFNPRATVGSALLVGTVTMLFPVLATVAAAALFDLSTELEGDALSEAEVVAQLAAPVALVIGSLLQAIGLIFVTGMVSHVALAAAVGRRMSLGEAWQATRGRRWRLLGLALFWFLAWVVSLAVYVVLWVLVVLGGEPAVTLVWGLLTVPAYVALMIWSWTRLYYLGVPALMLERLGVLACIGRAFRLTGKQFWRTFGIALLTVLITSFAAQIVSVPFSIVGVAAPLLAPGLAGAYVGLLAQALGSVLASAFVTPYSAAVASLQYLDQRMRKEGYDLVLMSEAGIHAP